jgi:cell wall-associated NlpC family hydrolase
MERKEFSNMQKSLALFIVLSMIIIFGGGQTYASSMESGKVTATYLAFRSAPSLSAHIIKYLPQNTPLSIVEKLSNGWMKVQNNQATGYVYGKYIKSVPQWEKKADSIIAEGKTFMGTPYVFGAKRFQTQSFDCSSFVQYVYGQYGISLGWTSRDQALQGKWIPFNQMRKGDLMFFSDVAYPNEVGINKVRHVGIYMGNGKILHTYEAGIGVVISNLRNDSREGNYWYQNFLFAKRVISE